MALDENVDTFLVGPHSFLTDEYNHKFVGCTQGNTLIHAARGNRELHVTYREIRPIYETRMEVVLDVMERQGDTINHSAHTMIATLNAQRLTGDVDTFTTPYGPLVVSLASVTKSTSRSEPQLGTLGADVEKYELVRFHVERPNRA